MSSSIPCQAKPDTHEKKFSCIIAGESLTIVSDEDEQLLMAAQAQLERLCSGSGAMGAEHKKKMLIFAAFSCALELAKRDAAEKRLSSELDNLLSATI